jgi:NADH:ubiquinone oxidoreductase subunit E
MMVNSLETFWEHILSHSSERIFAAYEALNEEEQNAILAHLERMSTEPGWQPDQVISANAALRSIARKPNEIS